ncbi:MAG: hypothetical protein ACLU0O_02605 [Collinsella sp.]
MIKGFDAAAVDMQVGEKKTVHIPAADATASTIPRWLLPSRPSRFPTSSRSRRVKLFLSTPSGMPVPPSSST